MMESLTSSLVTSAREIIKEVDSIGGMTQAIASGMAKLRIEESATRKQARIDAREDVIVGINKYQLKEEKPIDVLSIDNESVRISQTKKLSDLRATRDTQKVKDALNRLTESARMSGMCSGWR
jgi:methylmalonyl-CoA mutase